MEKTTKHSLLAPLKRLLACQHLDFNPVKLILVFDFKKYKMINSCCTPPSLRYCNSSYRKKIQIFGSKKYQKNIGIVLKLDNGENFEEYGRKILDCPECTVGRNTNVKHYWWGLQSSEERNREKVFTKYLNHYTENW